MTIIRMHQSLAGPFPMIGELQHFNTDKSRRGASNGDLQLSKILGEFFGGFIQANHLGGNSRNNGAYVVFCR
jgi:hypothetical protein